MITISKYHIDTYNKFLKEYSKSDGLDVTSVHENEVDYYKALDNYFPQIEVHFKNGKIFTVNRVDEVSISWIKGKL